jgi:uncharacterized protein (TIGR03435 family)
MRNAILIVLCLLVCGSLPAQQAAEAPPAFAVATIKPSAPDAATITQIRGNRFYTEGTTFVDIFKYAYSVHPEQIVGGPDWLRTKKFDILADPETEKRPSSDQIKAMVQQLLVERFHLTLHREQKLLPVYALMKSADVPRLTKSTADPNGIPTVASSGHGDLGVGNATMANFATFLQRFALDRPVIDRTGLAGHYDLVLQWTPDGLGNDGKRAEAPEDAPDLFTAIKEQLGLKLQPMKANADVFVIDRAEQPTEN